MGEPDILLVVCDALRKDVLQIYGGPAKTPNLLKLAEDAVVYDNAITPSPWTFPSHVSLFTGLYPNEHGVHETENIKLEELIKLNINLERERLAERLSRMGYNTSGISNNAMVSPQAGFDIGFHFYFALGSNYWNMVAAGERKLLEDALNTGTNTMEIALGLLKQGKFVELFYLARLRNKIRLTSKVLNFPLDKGGEQTNRILERAGWTSPFFRFINFMEAHDPYRNYDYKKVWDHQAGIRKISQKHVNKIRMGYVEEAEYLDAQIGRLMSTLKRVGKYENTMIIITADHGQALNEQGYIGHGTYLYDEITRIPLIIKYPKAKKFEKKKGYQNLVYIPNLINDILEGGDDSRLYSEVTFTESYGTSSFLPSVYKNRVKNLDGKPRKAVYKDGFKITVDGSEGIIEEFTLNGKPINLEDYRQIAKELLTELEIFKGKEPFKLPEIN